MQRHETLIRIKYGPKFQIWSKLLEIHGQFTKFEIPRSENIIEMAGHIEFN